MIAYSHEVLLCVQTGKTMNEENRMRFSTNEFYLKTLDEMRMNFADFPDSLFNTCKIADMIDLDIELGNPVLPNLKCMRDLNLRLPTCVILFTRALTGYTEGGCPKRRKKESSMTFP
jgi:DNA polymerase III alpha subunit